MVSRYSLTGTIKADSFILEASSVMAIRHGVFTTLLSLWLSVCGAAQCASPEQLDQSHLGARVDELFRKWNRTDSPGCAVSVMKDGHIVYEHGYGMADLDHNVTITPSTVFHVASMSKQFTAASILLLNQQGKLSLDDDTRKYIPELHNFGTRITIRELINHTSGLRDQWVLLDLAGWRYSLDLITDDDVMAVVARQKELNFKPGDKYVYSNTEYTLLALIVKRVSGMSFREFTTRNIFEPLGMKNTHFRDDHAEIVKDNAYGYAPEEDGFRLSNTQFDTVGATSLHTTVEDLALWDENFYQPRIGGPAFASEMLQRGTLNNGEQTDYAFGLEVGAYRGLPTVGHSGGDAGYRSDMVRFPTQHFSAAVLCNSSDSDPVIEVQKIADIYLSGEMKPDASGTAVAAHPATTPVQLTQQELSSVVGLYWNRDDDDFMKAYLKDGRLHTVSANDGDLVLKPVSPTYFHVADLSYGDQINITFDQIVQGKSHRVSESFEDEKPEVYQSVEESAPRANDLADYSGTYASDEIDPVYRVFVQDGKLSLAWLKHKPMALDPRTRDAFSGPLGTIRFTRDSKQRISGFALSNYSVRNFRFVRRTE
jgi:CubicO group peptidase (beta-lactamase class C family)